MNKVWQALSEPAPVVGENGTKQWYNKDGELHRDHDLPAIIFIDGTCWWYKNGVRYYPNKLG